MIRRVAFGLFIVLVSVTRLARPARGSARLPLGGQIEESCASTLFGQNVIGGYYKNLLVFRVRVILVVSISLYFGLPLLKYTM